MYVAYFNLREPPFSIAPDPAYLYMSARHQEALGHLLYGTGQYGGFVQLTGEVGTGKTTIIRTLLKQQLDDVEVAMIHNPRQNEAEFVESICDELKVDYPHDAPTLKQLVDALNAHLLDAHAKGRRTVLIIDEAQNLSPQVLEQVRLLTNLETDKEKLLRIMLVGQPELSTLLARPDLRQLASRVTARYHLLPLRSEETREYIHHRLHVAGGRTDLFSPAAIRLIHRRSGGVPRLVNIICDRALLGAYAQRAQQVTSAIANNAANEALGTPVALRWFQTLRRRLPRRLPLVWLEAALACAGLIIAGVLLANVFSNPSVPAPRVAAKAVLAQPDAPAASRAAPTPPGPEDNKTVAESTAQTVATPKSVDHIKTVGLGTLLQKPEALGTLMGRLISLWDAKLKIPANANVCAALHTAEIECKHGKAHWVDLDQMNRPALLTLSLGRNHTQYVLLRHLKGDNAILDTASGPLKIPLAQLTRVWDGEYLLLWKNSSGIVQIDQSTHGAPVVWLRHQLALAAGQTPPGTLSPDFGPSLKQKLEAYQRRNGLAVDGIAGTQTLMPLAAVGHETSTPMLHPTGQS